MINPGDALNIIIEEAKLLSSEEKHILNCLNDVLAEDIYSKDNLPPFDKSAMDGYAIKSEDSVNCSEENIGGFKIKGLIKAGDFCEEVIKAGEAYKIMTGAAVPQGADAVIQIEKVRTEDETLYLSEAVKKDNNIIKLGEEIKIGDLALSKGTVIRPVEVGLLSSLGYEYIKVYRKPTVALIITGDELVDIHSQIQKGKIRNSNEYSLKAMLKNLNCDGLSLGIVPDNKEALKEKMEYALEHADIVLSSGGASVGDYDFVRGILEEIGADIKFTSVAVKPGKPLTFATIKDKLFFALPGNPMAIINDFQEFVRPAIEKMMGKSQIFKEEFPVILADNFRGKAGRQKYLYVHIKKQEGSYYAYKAGSQSSNHLMTMSRANGVVIIPKGCENVQAGECFNGKFIFR
ncbi:MAG: molybdopterin molybdotransferase MoeA [Bacillota bacterium]|nr:molybdopterin molybdotransferase MoeA [Bacillota bacterium]